MQLANIYIGYNLEYEECLLEKQEDIYIDLFSRRVYKQDEIYINCLIPFSMIDTSSKKRALWRIKQIYLQDREQEIDITKLFVGDIILIKKILSSECKKQNLQNMEVSTSYRASTIQENALLLEDNDGYKYRNFVNNEEYYNALGLRVGDIRIYEDSLEPFNSFLPCGSERTQTKKKVLEGYYKTLGKGVL